MLEYLRWDLVIEVPNRIYSTQIKWVEVPHRGLKYPKLVVNVLKVGKGEGGRSTQEKGSSTQEVGHTYHH